MNIKCMVKGCSNDRHHGTFVEGCDICAPCYQYITTGIIGPTDSFLGDLQRENDRLKEENEKLRDHISTRIEIEENKV